METDSIYNKQGESMAEVKISYRSAKSIINFNPVEITETEQGDFTIKLDDSNDNGIVKSLKDPPPKGVPFILRRKDSARILEQDIKKCGEKARQAGKVIVSCISLNDTYEETRPKTIAAWNVIHRRTKWTLCVHSDTPKALSLIDEISPERTDVRLTIKTTAPDQWDEEALKELNAVSQKGYKISAILAPCHPIQNWKASLEAIFQQLPTPTKVWADCKAIIKKGKNKRASAFEREEAMRRFYEALADVASTRDFKFHFILGHGARVHWWAKKKGVVPNVASQATPSGTLADEIYHYLQNEDPDNAPARADVTKLLHKLTECRKAGVEEYEIFYELCHLGSNAEQKLKERRKHFFILCKKHWNYSIPHSYRLYDAGGFLKALKERDVAVSHPVYVSHVAALLKLEELKDQVDCWIWIAKTLPFEKLSKTEIEKEVIFYANREHKKLKKKQGSGHATLRASSLKDDLAKILDQVKLAYPAHPELHARLKGMEELLGTLSSPASQPDEGQEVLTETKLSTKDTDSSREEISEIAVVAPMKDEPSEVGPESDDAQQTPSLF